MQRENGTLNSEILKLWSQTNFGATLLGTAVVSSKLANLIVSSFRGDKHYSSTFSPFYKSMLSLVRFLFVLSYFILQYNCPVNLKLPNNPLLCGSHLAVICIGWAPCVPCVACALTICKRCIFPPESVLR